MVMTLDAQLETTIRRKVEAGHYRDADEVVREALRHLEEHERITRLRAKLAVAEEQADRGEVVEFTDELFEELVREADEMHRQGKLPDPDVCP